MALNPSGDPCTKSTRQFFTKSGTLVAQGYERVVYGKRGAYIEFTRLQLKDDCWIIPRDQKWRLYARDGCITSPYYTEYRSNDPAYVKLYQQRRTVAR